jgi:methyltransferase (TIGR00027 family)
MLPMKAGQHSRTADLSAAARAAHLLYDWPIVFNDPLAIRLVSTGWRRTIKTPGLYRLVALANGITGWRGTFVARARFTEERLERAIQTGIEQYVILGAGLDSFAWRQPEFARDLAIFEVDHPASQRAKRQRLQRTGLPTPANLEWLASDLAKETVAEALLRSRYRPQARSFFSLLGTVQYLPREAVMNTLRSIASIAAPASELVVSYVQPRELIAPKLRPGFDRSLRAFARQGEPFVSLFDPQEFPAAVCALGFTLIENCAPHETELRYFAGRSDALKAGSQRLSYIAHFRVKD